MAEAHRHEAVHLPPPRTRAIQYAEFSSQMDCEAGWLERLALEAVIPRALEPSPQQTHMSADHNENELQSNANSHCKLCLVTREKQTRQITKPGSGEQPDRLRARCYLTAPRDGGPSLLS